MIKPAVFTALLILCCFAVQGKAGYDRAKAQEWLDCITPTNDEVSLNFALYDPSVVTNAYSGWCSSAIQLTRDDFTVMTQRLAAVRSLKSLSLDNRTSRQLCMDLSFLAGATNLSEISLNGFDIQSCRPLAALPCRKMELSYVKICDSAGLGMMKRLEKLRLDTLLQDSLEGWTWPRDLVELVVVPETFEEDVEGLPKLADFPRLQVLNIGSTSLLKMLDACGPEVRLTALTSLTVYLEDSDDSVGLLDKLAARFPCLTRLTIEGDKYVFLEEDVSSLGMLPLKRLDISESRIRRIRGLEKCPLEELTLARSPLSSLADICRLPRLQRLAFKDTGIVRLTRAEVVRHFPGLKRVEWNDPQGDTHDHIIEERFEKIEDDACYVMAAEQAKRRIVILGDQHWDAEWEGTANPPEDYGIVWEWRPEQDPGIVEADRSFFVDPDECKGCDGGKTILMTASGGAFAAIDVASKRVKCYGVVGGDPHSIEMLPDGRFVVASSNGDVLTLVDASKGPFNGRDQVKKAIPFRQARGVHWDAKRQVLWAIGGDEIAKYAYDASAMNLEKLKGFPLSAAGLSGGCDLGEGEGVSFSGHFGKDCLAFTTRDGLGFFNRATEQYVSCEKSEPRNSWSIRSVCQLAVVPESHELTDHRIISMCGCEIWIYEVKDAKFAKARFLVTVRGRPEE